MSVSDLSNSISDYSVNQSDAYECDDEATTLNFHAQTQQAQEVLQQQLRELGIEQDISVSNIPFFQSYDEFLTAAPYDNKNISAPTSAYKEFIDFKATLPPRNQDLLTIDFTPENQQLVFKVAGTTVCELGSDYTNRLTDEACNRLVYEMASEQFQKAVNSFENKQKSVGAIRICQPIMDAYLQLLEKGDTDENFDKGVRAIGCAYEQMKTQLPPGYRDRVQLSVDLEKNSLSLSMLGIEIFNYTKPSFAVDPVQSVCELAQTVLSLSLSNGGNQDITETAYNCFF
ncbi:hypothetical protein SOPP22_02280 [Shewanella sp. OPT22]|nr:hypothetical protein SOPP22_02280 [Shewanella sp. OPT22]